MHSTKSLKNKLVGWACLTLGATALSAACSPDDARTFNVGTEGGTAGAHADGDAGGSDPQAGAGNTQPAGGSGNAGGESSSAAGDSSTGTAGADGADGGSAPTSSGGQASTGDGGVGGGQDPVEPAPSVCDGATQVFSINDAYIDNFETDTRFASWYAYSDTPVPNTPAPARTGTGAVTTDFRLSLAASNIETQEQGGYGAGLGYNMINVGAGTCIDLSAFDGISFWARGTSPTDKVTFQLVVPASQPANSQPPGDCLANCFGHPQRVFTIGDTWQHFTIAFSQLTKSPAAYEGHAMMFNFITLDTSWDISIDEVTFYKGTAPPGAISP